jgi:hypothetical protein
MDRVGQVVIAISILSSLSPRGLVTTAMLRSSRRHVDGGQCRGSVALIDEAARLRGLLGPAAALKAAGVSTGLLVAAPTAIHRSTGVLISPLLLY